MHININNNNNTNIHKALNAIIKRWIWGAGSHIGKDDSRNCCLMRQIKVLSVG